MILLSEYFGQDSDRTGRVFLGPNDVPTIEMYRAGRLIDSKSYPLNTLQEVEDIAEDFASSGRILL